MYWIGVGLFALGTLCGTFVRFPFFVLVLLGAMVIAVVSVPAQGTASTLLNALVAVVVLQVGYAVGIILRAVLRSLRSVSPDAATAARKRAVRFPPGQKHR
jgi:hypothetical protein